MLTQADTARAERWDAFFKELEELEKRGHLPFFHNKLGGLQPSPPPYRVLVLLLGPSFEQSMAAEAEHAARQTTAHTKQPTSHTQQGTREEQWRLRSLGARRGPHVLQVSVQANKGEDGAEQNRIEYTEGSCT